MHQVRTTTLLRALEALKIPEFEYTWNENKYSNVEALMLLSTHEQRPHRLSQAAEPEWQWQMKDIVYDNQLKHNITVWRLSQQVLGIRVFELSGQSCDYRK